MATLFDDTRAAVLNSLNHGADAVQAVLAYAKSPFQAPVVEAPVFPLADEPHVAVWREYAREAGGDTFTYLQERLPQLQIPIREGISKTDEYAGVARRGQPFSVESFGGRLSLERPEELRLAVHEHPAGALPVLATPHRGDFETLGQALSSRSEPDAISPAVNALMVAGFINWDRVRRHREAWSSGKADFAVEFGWPQERARVGKEEPWRFQDRFMLTCMRPYSDVTAAELGLEMSEVDWLRVSNELRVEHEFTHYATKRVYGSMSLNLLDETICDFMGITYALGRYQADWYLRFLGLESWPEIRPTGRVHAYRQEMTAAAFTLLCEVVVRAAAGLERIARDHYRSEHRGRFLLALAPLSLELLASNEAERLFAESYRRAEALVEAGAAV